jgi:mannose-6-phosphate isomerase-like protein (cupin superfamily)
MTGYIANIEQSTVENAFFRHVLHTSQHQQLVVMCLKPNEDIGEETHEIVDQFLRIEEGQAKAILNGETTEIKAGDAIMVPAGVTHNIINTSSTDQLKLYTVYSPPHHKDGTIHKTKENAESDTADHI